MSTSPPPDLEQKGIAHAEAFEDYAAWSRFMLWRYGRSVKPHLPAIWLTAKGDTPETEQAIKKGDIQPFWFSSGCLTTLVVIACLWLKSNGLHLGTALREEDTSEVAVGLSVPIACFAWVTFAGIRSMLRSRTERRAVMADQQERLTGSDAQL